MDSNSDLRRALFVLPSDRMGGAERIVSTVAATAAKAGHFSAVDVLVLCWEPLGCLVEALESPKIQLHYLRARTKFGGVLLGILWLLRKHRQRYRFVFSSAAFVNAFLSLSRRAGLLKTERLVTRESTIAFDRFSGWRRLAVRVFYYLYGAQDLIVCQTERMRASVSRNTGGRLDRFLMTLPNPLCMRSTSMVRNVVMVEDEVDSSTAFRIVWCGRFSAVKAPKRAIEVLWNILREGVSAHLVMIGDGQERAEAEMLAAVFGITERVTFVGHTSDPFKFMSDCDVGMVTSDVEGFPNVILEMLASGVTRIVATNCAGGLEEIPGVVVVGSSDSRRIAEAIINLGRNSTNANAIREYLQARSVEAFWNSISTAMNVQQAVDESHG